MSPVLRWLVPNWFSCGAGLIIQGTCSEKLNKLEVAIESCKAKGSGGVHNFQKATKDLESAKSCLDKFAGLQPAAVTDVEADEAKSVLLTCRQHKEGLTKTLQEAKVLLEQTFNWQIHHVSENRWLWKTCCLRHSFCLRHQFCFCFGQLVCFQLFGVEFVLVSRLGKVDSVFLFQAKEKWRTKHSSQSLGCYGVLAEMRGDWKCFAETFHLPSWAHKSGICMKCTATTANFKDVAAKFQKLSHWDFINRQLDLQRPISTIYSVPLFLASNFKLDWLHVVDLGVTLDSGLFGQLVSLFIAKTWQ